MTADSRCDIFQGACPCTFLWPCPVTWSPSMGTIHVCLRRGRSLAPQGVRKSQENNEQRSSHSGVHGLRSAHTDNLEHGVRGGCPHGRAAGSESSRESAQVASCQSGACIDLICPPRECVDFLKYIELHRSEQSTSGRVLHIRLSNPSFYDR